MLIDAGDVAGGLGLLERLFPGVASAKPDLVFSLKVH
jgi:hypothetical protein